MERRVTLNNHRQMTQLAGRRRFLQLSGKMGLMAAVMGLTDIHFCGDTAYHSLFKEIGRKYGPFDYGLVPIGAYRPQPMKNGAHATPEEAVKLGRDLRANKLIPIHWGSIILSQAPPFEAPERFLKAGLEAGYDEFPSGK